jgi:hypothetical protein
VVNLHYTDAAGGYYVNTVFNDTITVQEDESSFNSETAFLVALNYLVVIQCHFLVHPAHWLGCAVVVGWSSLFVEVHPQKPCYLSKQA